MTEAFTFIDVEASGWNGVPVEVGWATLPANFSTPEAAVRSDGFLVRPAGRWLADPTIEWNPSAERLHGINRETLMAEGLAVERCLEILSTELAGRAVWCDSRGLDQAWLEVLWAEPAGVMGLPFRVGHWSDLFGRYWSEHSAPVLAARRVLTELPVHHRARLDAVRLALAFAAAWSADGRNQ